MTKVYCVMRNGGEWEDAYSYVDKAFFDESIAEKYKNFKNEQLKQRKTEEEYKIKVFNETDTTKMTEEEREAFYEKYETNYFVFDQHEFTIDVIDVE